METPDTKRILVVLREEVLAAGIVSVLSREESVGAIRISSGFEFLQNQPHEDDFRPDVIVIDEKLKLIDLAGLMHLVHLTEIREKVRIVIVDIEGNRLTVYDKSEIQLLEVNDLIATLL